MTVTQRDWRPEGERPDRRLCAWADGRIAARVAALMAQFCVLAFGRVEGSGLLEHTLTASASTEIISVVGGPFTKRSRGRSGNLFHR